MSSSEEGAFWTILSYLIAGLILWCGIGLLVDHFLKTTFFVLIGMAIGLGSSLYLIWVRFIRIAK
jgi:ATP synthase protein I